MCGIDWYVCQLYEPYRPSLLLPPLFLIASIQLLAKQMSLITTQHTPNATPQSTPPITLHKQRPRHNRLPRNHSHPNFISTPNVCSSPHSLAVCVVPSPSSTMRLRPSLAFLTD